MWNKVLLITIISVVLIGLGFLTLKSPNVHKDNVTLDSADEDIIWNTYENELYDFSITYPPSWNVSESFDALPSIIFSKPNKKDETFVAIYPRGVEQGEDYVDSIPTHIEFEDQTFEGRDLLLSSGIAWATRVSFTETPESWKRWGYVLGQIEVKGFSVMCRSAGTIIPVEECNTLEGDSLVRIGTRDKKDFETMSEIIKSFKFIK